MAGWVWNEGVELCQSNQHLCCLPKEMRLFETACWFGMLPGGHNPEFKASAGFSRCRIFPMVVDREDVLKEHQKTAFGSSGNAVKVAYRPLEGYPCAFLSFFDAEKLKRVLNSRGISAGLRAQFLSISVVYASSQPFQTLLVVLEAVVSRGWWSQVWQQKGMLWVQQRMEARLKKSWSGGDCRDSERYGYTTIARRLDIWLWKDKRCLMYYLQKAVGSKQPIWWWHGFQRSDNLQMGWSREMADDLLKRFKQCSVVRSVWRRFDTSTLLSWCEDVMD